MKRLVVAIALAWVSLCALPERDFINLKVSPVLEKNQLLIQIQHRFYGSVNDPVFGMASGANDVLGLRYHLWSGLELNGGFIVSRQEFTVGTAFGYYFRPAHLRSQIDIGYFNFKDALLNRRPGSVFGLVSLESVPILKTFTPLVNVGYDGLNRRFGFGGGLAAQIGIDIPPFKSIALIGEFFPVVKPDSGKTGANNCFGVGIKFETWGHHFIFMVGNSSEIGTRRWMLGTPDTGLHLGFNINRMIDLGAGL